MTEEVNIPAEGATPAISADVGSGEASAAPGTVGAPAPETAPETAPASISGPIQTPEDAEVAAYLGKLKTILENVPTNSSAVEFPADPWGMTTDVRRAGLLAASSIRGNKLKQVMLLGTFEIIKKHIINRFDVDRAELEKTLREIAESETKSAALNRVYGTPVPAGE